MWQPKNENTSTNQNEVNITGINTSQKPNGETESSPQMRVHPFSLCLQLSACHFPHPPSPSLSLSHTHTHTHSRFKVCPLYNSSIKEMWLCFISEQTQTASRQQTNALSCKAFPSLLHGPRPNNMPPPLLGTKRRKLGLPWWSSGYHLALPLLWA